MEGTASFGSNVVSFLLNSGTVKWYVVGSYVTPNNVLAIHRVEQALIAARKGLDMVLMGDMDARLGDPCDKCE